VQLGHSPNACKLYLQKTVVEATTERIEWIFDTFETISVSISGGKDSTVLFELAHREAIRRGRKINVFFLDQEAEYAATIEIIKDIMAKELIVPCWYQVPCRMTNATSYEDEWLYAWEPGADWIHPKVDISIKDPLPVDRFYRIMEWVDNNWGPNSCSLVGLRSEESLNRYSAVTRNPAIPGVNWSSRTTGGECMKLYPIYDWTFEDVWTFIGTEKLRYNPVYDWMYVKGFNIPEMRVSNLIHEKAYKCLATLQEFEPDTYERIVRRVKGVHIAARYGKSPQVFAARKLPHGFETWKAYRDFLLDTLPIPQETREVFIKRFAGQNENERVYRQQVHQLQINDWENNVPVANVKKKENPLEKWMEIL